MSLNDSIALITGASHGLGRAIALGLARAGADVAIAARADVPQLVQDGGQLLVQRQILKPRQVEAQKVEHLPPELVPHLLDRPQPAATVLDRLPAGKAQRRERGVHAKRARLPRAAAADQHPLHVDMRQLRQPGHDVAAEPVHLRRVVQRQARSITRASPCRRGRGRSHVLAQATIAQRHGLAPCTAGAGEAAWPGNGPITSPASTAASGAGRSGPVPFREGGAHGPLDLPVADAGELQDRPRARIPHPRTWQPHDPRVAAGPVAEAGGDLR